MTLPDDQAFTVAATRDAARYSRPDTWDPKRVHVVGYDDTSGCGRSRLTDDYIPLVDVPADQRCRRRGCAERWPA